MNAETALLYRIMISFQEDQLVSPSSDQRPSTIDEKHVVNY